MAYSRMSWQPGVKIIASKSIAHIPHVPFAVKALPIKADNAARFLSTVLQGMQP